MTRAHLQTDIHRFDRWAATYDRSPLQRFFLQPVQRAVLFAATGMRPESVLDIGCGTGKLLRTARVVWPGARIIGVDPSSGMIDRARSLLPDAELFVARAEELPLPAESLDLAFSTLSMHHWSDAVRGIAEVARVLRPGGRFVVADLAVPGWLMRAIGDHPALRVEGLRGAFDAAGLQIEGHRRARGGLVLITTGSKPR